MTSFDPPRKKGKGYAGRFSMPKLVPMPEVEANPPEARGLESSRLVAEREAVESELNAKSARSLTGEEVDHLVEQGNSARDWRGVKVLEKFSVDSIVGNRFEGTVILGRSEIFYSTLADCVVGPDCRISHCGRLSRYLVGAGALIENVGRIEMSRETSEFGNDLELFHEELFSRALRTVAELPFGCAAWIGGPEAARSRKRADSLRAQINSYALGMKSDRGYLAPGVQILGATAIENCWIGRGVEIIGAGTLRDSTFWTDGGKPTVIRDGAQVRHSLIGPGCMIENLACVENSIFFEEVFAGCQAIVKGSAVGANTRLSASECNDCLLGPFSMAIHHGLILAAWWPEGKGNIAYGSNVGSNHTGRAPDQEIWPGEGLFCGLGCNVKFPSNFREAPYTIIATGLTTLPQKVSFPFSLISAPTQVFRGAPPALNELQPGWGLVRNAYGIERHERNMAKRNRARRMRIETEILRPDILGLCERAMIRLKRAKKQIRPFYTGREIPGLGKNVMTERARAEGLKAYAWGLRIGAARRLLRELEVEENSANLEGLNWCVGILGESAPRLLLDLAMKIHAEWVKLVIESKAVDDRRGIAILDDYEERHLTVERDPLVAEIQAEHRRHRDAMKKYLSVLQRLRNR